MARAQSLALETVQVHDVLHCYVVAAGDVVNVLVPFDRVLRVGGGRTFRLLLRDRFPLGFRGGIFLERNKQDGIFLQPGFPQGGIGLVKVFFGDPISLADAVERLPLQHDVGKIYLPVQFHFLLGDGDGGGHIFLGQGCAAAQDKE